VDVTHTEPPALPLVCAPARGSQGTCKAGTVPYDELAAALAPLTCTERAVPAAVATSDAARRAMCVARRMPLLDSDITLLAPLLVRIRPRGGGEEGRSSAQHGTAGADKTGRLLVASWHLLSAPRCTILC
jgi:hypothetical protein